LVQPVSEVADPPESKSPCSVLPIVVILKEEAGIVHETLIQAIEEKADFNHPPSKDPGLTSCFERLLS
jgi:hypothetical protein